MYLQCSRRVLDLVPIQKGTRNNIVVEKMTINTQVKLDDMGQKLLKANSKYKKVINRHNHVKVFIERDLGDGGSIQKEILGGVLW